MKEQRPLTTRRHCPPENNGAGTGKLAGKREERSETKKNRSSKPSQFLSNPHDLATLNGRIKKFGGRKGERERNGGRNRREGGGFENIWERRREGRVWFGE